MSQEMISRVDELWKELKIPVCMAAYVGDKYEEQDERILVIGERWGEGERAYEADEITPEQFYGNENGLSAGQQQWFNYRSAVKLRKTSFFRTIERSLKKAGYSMDDIAMFNFFQRPMLEHKCVDDDIEMGRKACYGAIKLLRPTKVVIASRKVANLLEQNRFRDFAETANFKYICVNNPSPRHWNRPQSGQPYSSRELFENFIMHGQERFRLLSEQFQTAIERRDLDDLIHLAKDFQAEVDFMNNKRQGKCGKVKTEEDKEKYVINCKKARITKKANKVCSIITDLLQKSYNEIKDVRETVVPSLDNLRQEEIKMEMIVRRKMALKEAEIKIAKFKEEFAQDDDVKEQLDKGVSQISNALNTQLVAIDTLIASI